MSTPPPPQTDPDRDPVSFRFRKPIGFAAGLGGGFLLWLLIGLTTGNLSLGLLFGFAPGVAIGVGLQLTAPR